MAFPCVCLAFSQHGGWIPRASLPRESGGSYVAFYSLVLEVTQHHFHYSQSLSRFKEKKHAPLLLVERWGACQCHLKGKHKGMFVQSSVENAICHKVEKADHLGLLTWSLMTVLSKDSSKDHL